MEIYPFNEFLAHFADWGFVRDYHHVTIGSTTAPVTGQRDVTSSVLRARDYMQQKYGDTPEAAEKAKLFSLIQLYLAQHAKGFDRDSLAVCGTEQGLVSQHLLRGQRHMLRATAAPNQSMKPTAPLRYNLSVFATTSCRGLSPSR
jgi:hypothetical protein